MGGSGGKADFVEKDTGSLVECAGILLGVSSHGGNEDILQNSALGEQMMELEDEAHGEIAIGGGFFGVELLQILAVDPNFSRGGGVQSPNDVEQCTFAGAGWANDSCTGACSEFEVDILKYSKGPSAFGTWVRFADVFEFDHGEEKRDES